MPILPVALSFDFVCPWCLIGKRHLETAIAQLREERPDVEVVVDWQAFPLMPDTPPEGRPFREFYLARLGSAQAVAARQAQVQAAAQSAGLSLALQQIETFPNTLLAHRLVRFAHEARGADAAAALVEEIFARYFLRAQDIGDAKVLGEALAACGLSLPDTLPPLPEPGYRGTGVPYFVFGDSLGVPGAAPPDVLLHAMRHVLARRAETLVAD